MIIPHNTILTAVVNAAFIPPDEAPHTLHGTRGDTVEADVQLTFTCWHISTNGYLLANTVANSNTEKFTATSEI